MNNNQTSINVSLGANPKIGECVIIGYDPTGDNRALIIGDRCNIRSHTVIYAGSKIGDNFQTGHHVLIREENTIGNNVSIGSSTVIEHHITIGNEVRIHSQAFVPEYTVLEDGVWIGPNVVLTNAKYPNAPDTKENLKGPILKRGCKIGANATILPGVCIGEDSLVGAGSVVTKDVPAGVVVAGVPAKTICRIEDISSYR